MLSLQLLPIFEARGIERPYSFLVKSGFTHHTASSLLHGNTRSFRLDHIETLCRVLVCEPNDLLAWTPDKNIIYPVHNPLEKLRPTSSQIDLKASLSALPYNSLKEITKNILDVIDETTTE